MKTRFPSHLLFWGSFLFANTQFFAQNQLAGSVQDAVGKPLPFANVLLLAAADSSLFSGNITSETGGFIFENVPGGDFFLQISTLGFEPFFSKKIVFDEKTGRKMTENVVLHENSTLLGEATVLAKRPFLEQKIDRTVVNVANSITKAGGTALQVLQRSPGVQVNEQTKNISLSGKQGVVVMINGKASRLPADAVVDMLAGMNADNIDRIELIHTPPANFEAEGNAGIINIILKNTGEAGLNGGYSAKIGQGRGGKYGGGAYFNFRKNKVNFFGNYDHNYTLNPQLFTNYRRVKIGPDVFETDTRSDRPHTPTTTQNAQIGADFQISKKTVFGVLGSFFDRNWYMEAVGDTKYLKNGSVDSTLRMPNSETNLSRSFAGNVNLAHQFSARQTLNLDADFINYDITNPSDYSLENSGANGQITSTSGLRISKKTPIQVAVAKADFTQSFRGNMTLETGAKMTSLRFDNDVRVDRQTGIMPWENIAVLTSRFKLDEDVFGAYTSFSAKLDEKTNLKAGLRYEFTSTNLGSEERPNLVDRKYGRWFPSVFIDRKLSEVQNLNLSYSRRIARPTIRLLAPYLIFADPTTIEGGNSALQPSFTDALKLGYTFKTWNFSVAYSTEHGAIAFVPKVDQATNRQVNTYENLDNSKVASANLNFPFRPAKWWEMSQNFYVNSREINFKLEDKPLKINNIDYGINTTQTFTLPQKLTLEISANYDSPAYWGVAFWKPTGSLNLGLEKNFGQKWGKLRGSATDLFETQSTWIGTTDQPEIGLFVKSSYQMSERTFMISWSNTFGNSKLKSSRQRQTGAAEELRRI